MDYQAELKASGILISMSGRGNCFDNAMVETFFKTLTSELVWRTAFETRDGAAKVVGRYIDGFYNPIRRHSALDLTSPARSRFTASTSRRTAASGVQPSTPSPMGALPSVMPNCR